jgi:hypothetical protein
MNPLNPAAFNLPERLAAKAEPALISRDEEHFSAIANSLETQIADLVRHLDIQRKAPGGKGQEGVERDAEIRRITSRLRLMQRYGIDLCLGRMKMTDDFPPEGPAYINVYFSVDNCDDAVARATKLGGILRFGPMDSPFGRFAALSDPQGASFSVIDVTTTQGDMPQISDVP